MPGGSASLQIGQELYYPKVVNKSGENLINGTLVMVDPNNPSQGNRIRVVKSISDGTHLESLLIGVLTENIDDNQEGFATWFGMVRDVNKTHLEDAGLKYTGSAWAEGDILYPDSERPGGLTNIKPEAPNLKSTIGFVERITGNNIQILVRPQLGSHISNLHDVQIATASNNDILVYSATSSRFENRSSDLVLSGSFSGSYSGVYFGDGSNLENVQAAAAPLISSGSARHRCKW